jgi:hypothetical protein
MRIIRLHKRPTPELGTAEGCVKGLLESSTGQDNYKSLTDPYRVRQRFRNFCCGERAAVAGAIHELGSPANEEHEILVSWLILCC